MASRKTTEEVKDDIRRARANLSDDIAALDHRLHVDIPARLKRKIPVIAGIAGAAAVTAAAVAMARRRKAKSAAKKSAPKSTPKRQKR